MGFHYLAQELQSLDVAGFDLTVLGADLVPVARKSESKEFASNNKSPPISTAFGDSWRLGQHILLCADPSKPSILRACGGHKAGLAIIDTNEIVTAEVNAAACLRDCAEIFVSAKEAGSADAFAYIFTSSSRLAEILAAGAALPTELVSLCFWAREKPSDESDLYTDNVEPCAVLKVSGTADGALAARNRKRRRSNLWGARPSVDFSIAAPNPKKPASLFIDILRDASRPKDLVLGVLAGPNLLLAAEKTGRRVLLIDPRPESCDEAVRQWQNLTGKLAVRLEDTISGQTPLNMETHHDR